MAKPWLWHRGEMSTNDNIAKINGSGADLLAVFLSAKKAQAWLLHNHDQLRVPVRGQFGATINYQAGTVRRAPAVIRILDLNGFGVSRRSRTFGAVFERWSLADLFVIISCFTTAIDLRRRYSGNKELAIRSREQDGSVAISLIGHATKTQCGQSDRMLSQRARRKAKRHN